ncbi:hypothetical protein GM661_05265 [Iocasia frigidifontis]|uniref:Uncharacterized protein n=1 Tax=Iocasia fonsfrigidae TaxID=2682810 RepID=A0A8A7KHS5_9FIRM|nr:hypothetical protein [Iocasia fonsfrigidae]QTL97432.1 hypothetical protein GM661_05265 [Iocasia fonsfrigidae]
MNGSYIKKRIVEFFGILLFVTVILQVFFIDLLVLKNFITENSLTEIAQELILGIIISLFIYIAWLCPKLKYGMLVIAGFFACLLIREMDFLTDKISISWFYFVLAVVLGCLFLAIKYYESVIYGLNDFCKSDSYYIMVCGLILIFSFARLMGMKILWRNLLGTAYVRVVKNAVEEGSELVGYLLCLVSASKYTGSVLRKHGS